MAGVSTRGSLRKNPKKEDHFVTITGRNCSTHKNIFVLNRTQSRTPKLQQFVGFEHRGTVPSHGRRAWTLITAIVRMD
jgi:hypothetical protein